MLRVFLDTVTPKQYWPTYGPGGYITLAAWGVTNALEQGTQLEVAHKRAGWLHTRAAWGVPNALEWGTQS